MKAQIISAFPGLRSDPCFKITSDQTPEYNCIAWAAIRNDVFWWPDPRIPNIDGVEWPFNLPLNASLENFILLYQHLGYALCQSWKYEHQLQKLALYINQDTRLVTHAARQNYDGIWTSKLGPNHDITHINPMSLEGSKYGEVAAIMQRHNSSYNINKLKKFIERA